VIARSGSARIATSACSTVSRRGVCLSLPPCGGIGTTERIWCATQGGAPLAGYDPATYGEAVGDHYDDLYPGTGAETEAAVNLLAELADARPERTVVEFGVGTGRLALGLHQRGLRVAGIEGSERMVAQLRLKPDGNAIEVVVGDYRDAVVPGLFSLVVLALNGILDPRGRHAQLDIFRNAARHLAPGGCFVVEAWVMTDEQRNGDWSVVPRYVGDQHVELQLARYNIDTNTIERTLVHLRPDGLRFVTVTDTYASPGELDVMADVSGFDRRARYGSWSRPDFTATSRSHVSVYQLRRRAEGTPPSR
jgi:SAM-dependent methyltransferase